jgi:hypothetical protein
MRLSLRFATTICAAAVGAQAATPSVAPTPSIPQYGQPLTLELRNDWPTYLPATRYWISGNTVTIDYEFGDWFSPMPADFGYLPLSLGELVPGNYTVNARLFDINKPSSPPQVVTTNVPVLAPNQWGIYMVPQQPDAYQATQVMVRSAVYFDPASMRASVSGNVIRVDFDYYADAPTGGPAPAGSTSYGAVKIAALLAPGNYRVEGWGRAKSGGESQRYFTRDLAIGTLTPVVEYYSEKLDHYFMSAGPGEIAAIDADPQHAWKRTGLGWRVWLRQSDAPAGASAVCRFYATGPSSHFYTGDPAECGFLRSLEQQQRAEALSRGAAFTGWQYEGTAFYALMPQNGQCPGGADPVYRSYNMRGDQNDSNHRFTADAQMRAAMVQGWADEGVAFCSPR